MADETGSNTPDSKDPVSDLKKVKKSDNNKSIVEKISVSSSSEHRHSSADKTKEAKPAAELFSAKPIPKMQSAKSAKPWLIPGIIGILLIAALLVSGWTAYQQLLFNESWAERQNKINQQFNQQNATIEQAKNSGQASMQASNQTQLQLNQLATRNKQLADSLLSTQERIKALSGRQRQDWMLAEAAYLIKVAQLQLSLQKDKATAIQLLRTADSRIIEIADNSLLPIREAIARDLSELSLILEPDVTGMSLALDAINQQIPNLEITALEFQALEGSLPKVAINEEGFSLEKIYHSFLNDFVVIKDHSEPVKPLMTSDQRANLNSNIQLAIQQAQITLLQGNETLYRLYIANAILWTEQFFIHDEKSNSVIEQLKQLQTKPVEAHYPNKLNAKQALDEISQQQLYHWLADSLSGNTNSNKLDNNLNQSIDDTLIKLETTEPSDQSEIKP